MAVFSSSSYQRFTLTKILSYGINKVAGYNSVVERISEECLTTKCYTLIPFVAVFHTFRSFVQKAKKKLFNY